MEYYVITPGTYTDHTNIHAKLQELCDKVDALGAEIKETRKLMHEHDEWERKGGSLMPPDVPPAYAPSAPSKYRV